MKPIHVGLVADPASPTDIARRMSDLHPPDGEDRRAWDIHVVSESFTIGCEDVATALARLGEHARRHEWDLVVGLTELPLRDDDDGRYLLVETDPQHRRAVLSLPALGGLRRYARTRHAVRALVGGMAERASEDEHRVRLSRVSGRWRLLLGMVLANRPWLLVPGLKSALVAALATGAIATINSTMWLLAGSLSWWRLMVASIASVALAVGWLVIDWPGSSHRPRPSAAASAADWSPTTRSVRPRTQSARRSAAPRPRTDLNPWLTFRSLPLPRSRSGSRLRSATLGRSVAPDFLVFAGRWAWSFRLVG